MKTFAATPRVRTAAFTMVEIALCLAIVGFALVAIIGVLPAGLNVQKENREETIINQDATLILNALRGSDRGNDELTNLFERITVTRTLFLPPNYVNSQPLPTIVGEVGRANGALVDLTEPANIIGLLSTPRYQPSERGLISNHVVAFVRAASGAATEKVTRDNPVRDMTFGYRLISEVTPPNLTDYFQQYTNDVGSAFARNLHDVRLVFAWPLIPPLDRNLGMPTNFGNARLIFRTQVGGAMGAFPVPSRTDDDMFFFYLNPDGNGRHL